MLNLGMPAFPDYEKTSAAPASRRVQPVTACTIVPVHMGPSGGQIMDKGLCTSSGVLPPIRGSRGNQKTQGQSQRAIGS